MLIDWFTVIAQVVNFLILVFLLQRFLYKPILSAIDAREKLIADQLTQAAAQQTEAHKQRDDFQHKNDDFDRQRGELLTKATADAKTENQQLLDKGRTEFDALRVQQADGLKRDREDAAKQIVALTSREAFAIARKTLSELASTNLEERITQVFIGRLKAISPDDKTRLATALAGATEPVLVRSAFDLPSAQQTSIGNAVKDTIGTSTGTRFETAPDLVSGIEMTTQGYKLSWSISEYLSSLEDSVDDALKVEHAN